MTENQPTTSESYRRPTWVKVGDVEDHPIFFDAEDGKLYGVVLGEVIEHRTLSTLRNLMFAAHQKSLTAVHVLVVERPNRTSFRASLKPPTRVAVVSRMEAISGNRSLAKPDGGTVSERDALVVPVDSADAQMVERGVAALLERYADEQVRHVAAVTAINTKTDEFLEALEQRHPFGAVFDRVEPEVKRGSHLRAFASRA